MLRHSRQSAMGDVPPDSPTLPSSQLDSSLLNLPIELFLIIWNQLPLQSRVSLLLTCRALYILNASTTLCELNLSTAHSRTHRSYFLRLLRKDLTDRNLFLCYACQKLHRLGHQRVKPPVSLDPYYLPANKQHSLPEGCGFPYCSSIYMRALQDVNDRLSSPRDRPMRVYTGSYRTSISIDYSVEVDVGFQGLYMKTEFNYSSHQYRYHDTAILPPKDFATFMRGVDIEFCPHLWLGHDFVPGDRSMSDRIEDVYANSILSNNKMGSFSMGCLPGNRRFLDDFVCKECHVDVKLQVQGSGFVVIFVWQYFDPKVLGSGERPAKVDGLVSMCREWEERVLVRKKGLWERCMDRVLRR